MLDLGAGAGTQGAWFAARGFDVTAVDISPRVVKLCRAKGLEAHVASFEDLPFAEGVFDATLAMSSLLHVPKPHWPAVLAEAARVLRPGGLLCVGSHGGRDHEGPEAKDPYDPPRFFVTFTDEHLRKALEARFEIVSFGTIDIGHENGHYQVAVARTGC
ncbi:MAG: class I SAM-dependent methyltransferase [Phycisphaerae bacterium]|nr:class I SAM-dependent methyltransferase [Phycisphaerae bacterium]